MYQRPQLIRDLDDDPISLIIMVIHQNFGEKSNLYINNIHNSQNFKNLDIYCLG